MTFNYPYIHSLRTKNPKVNWEIIEKDKEANPQKKGRRWLAKKYKQWVTNEGEIKPRIAPKNTVKNSATAKKDKKESNYLDRRGRLVKYGRIEPTGFKSGLSFQEWRMKYAKRLEKWDLQYIREIEELYFNVINNHDNELPFVPRDYGKSFIGIDFVTYLLLEQNLTILVITSGGGSTRRFLNGVKRILKSKEVRMDYGDLIEYENKVDGELWFKVRLENSIDADLRVVGRGADIIGSHPHLLFLEDFVQMPYKSTESEQGMRDWIAFVVDPINAPTTGTATRKDPDDIYGWMEKEGYTKLRVWPALTEEGIYPTRDDLVRVKAYHPKADKVVLRQMIRADFDLSGFKHLECPNHDLHSLLVRRLRNIRAFESEMMQRPIPAEGNYFDVDKFHIFDNIRAFNNIAKIIWVDPAFGESKGSSDTAIVVIALAYGRMNVLDCILGQFPRHKLIKEINRVGIKHNTVLAKIENDYSQISTRWSMSDFYPMRVAKFYASKLTRKISNTMDAKLQRISDLDVPFDMDLIWFYEGCENLTEMKSQYLRYNQRKGKWDLLDIVASAYHSNKNKLINKNTNQLYIDTW